jgi:hypothetical protein
MKVMALGLKRAMDRIKRKIKRKKGLLLASLVISFAISGVWFGVGQLQALGSDSNVKNDTSSFCPACKEHAYIGLGDQDYLTLYDGQPKDGIIIRRLFQIDIESMESTMHEGALDQLMNGIEVSDEVEYSSVLSTFSDYAVDSYD